MTGSPEHAGAGEPGIGSGSRSPDNVDARPDNVDAPPDNVDAPPDNVDAPPDDVSSWPRTRPGETPSAGGQPGNPSLVDGTRDLHEAGPGETSRRDRRPDSGDDSAERPGGRHVLDPSGDSQDLDDDRFIPPEPPPLPRGDFFITLAWVCVIGGPLLLLFAALAWRSIPGELILAAVVAFVGGFVTLVARMPNDHPDDPDDGAVV